MLCFEYLKPPQKLVVSCQLLVYFHHCIYSSPDRYYEDEIKSYKVAPIFSPWGRFLLDFFSS